MADAFHEIELDSASEAVQEIYKDIKFSLRFNDIPWLFRVLGEHEKFLGPAWAAIKPVLTDAFVQSADELRAESVALCTEALGKSEFTSPLSGSDLDSEAVNLFHEVLLAHHYVNPKLILIAHALRDALADKPPVVKSIVVMPTGRGVPLGMTPLDRVAGSDLPEHLKESGTTREIAAVPDFLSALAQRPGAASALWEKTVAALNAAEHEKISSQLDRLTSESVALLRRRMDLGHDELDKLGIEESEQENIREKVSAACDLYIKSQVDLALSALAVAGAETAAMSSEEFLLRWRLPRKRATKAR